MLVSDYHRFIFLRTEKTGSTSVFHALRELVGDHAGRGDVTPPAGVMRGRGGNLRKCFPRLFGPWMHADARQVRDAVGPERFGSYFKFSIVRNPWDAQVSLYSHRTSGDLAAEVARFRRRLHSPLWRAFHHARLRNWEIFSIDGAPCVDFMIRFERLHEDFQEVLRRIGQPGAVHLEHRRQGVRADGNDYRSWYDEATRDLVGDWYRREIEAFGYRF